MSDTKSFLVINAIVNKENMADVKTYLESSLPLFGKNGGKPIARYKTLEQLAGEDSPEMVGIMEFPNGETIKRMINGEDFLALADLRAKAFTKLNMMICGEM